MVVALAALALLQTSASQGDGPRYDLTWRPKNGQVQRYRISLDLKLDGGEVDIDGQLVCRVTRKDPNGPFDVTTTTKNLRAITSEGTQTIPDDSPTVEHYDAKGHVIESVQRSKNDEADPFGALMDISTDIRTPLAPVKLNEKWSVPITADKVSGRRAGKLDYRFTGLEKQGAVPIRHIKFAFTEIASGIADGDVKAKSEGYFQLDARDNSILNSEATVHNARISPDAEPGTVIIRLRRDN